MLFRSWSGGSKKKKSGDKPGDGGGGWMDKILTGLGIGDLLANFMPKGGIGPLFSKLNPFRGPKTKGGKPITGTRSVTGGSARVTTSAVAKQGGKKVGTKVLREFFKKLPIKAAALSFAIDMATGESIDRALAGLVGASVGA